jgi:hypothetical protein
LKLVDDASGATAARAIALNTAAPSRRQRLAEGCALVSNAEMLHETRRRHAPS